MKIRRVFTILLSTALLSSLTLLSGCKGRPGDVYLAYSWVSMPLYLYDENPSTPSTIHNGDYFSSNPGTYYMEYVAWDNSGWWMKYTLTANPGEMFFVDGADAKFEIALYSFGPSIYKWSNMADTNNVANSARGVLPSHGKSLARNERKLGPAAESESIRMSSQSSGYTLNISAGRLSRQ